VARWAGRLTFLAVNVVCLPSAENRLELRREAVAWCTANVLPICPQLSAELRANGLYQGELCVQVPVPRHMPRILAARSMVTPEVLPSVAAARAATGQVQTSKSLKMPAGMKRVRAA
jgi:hypothetical protein